MKKALIKIKQIFMNDRGIEKLEKVFLDDQLDILIQNNTSKEMLFLKLKQQLMERLYNNYEIQDGEEYLCYLCMNDSITPLCKSCMIKEKWVQDRMKKDTKTMKDYVGYKDKLNKDISNYLYHYFPDFIEKNSLSDKVKDVKQKKGTNVFINFYNKGIGNSLTPKFLFEIHTPEKKLSDKHTVVDIITSKAKPKVLFGDEYLKFMDKYKVFLWIMKISVFLFFMILFFATVYFTR